MKPASHVFVLSAFFVSIILLGASTAAAAENALPNSDFEASDSDGPRGWRDRIWNAPEQAPVMALSHDAKSGSHCLVIQAESPTDASWYCEVPVQPGALYRLSGWIKTEGVKPQDGVGALLNLHGRQVRTEAVTGTADWTYVETYFQAGDDDEVWVNCLFGGWGTATGTAWFDDVALEQVDLSQWEPAINVDLAKRRAPLSPYIYGQFIEHLGRCIQDGIWAEKLEDRKFYYAVGTDQSPWRTVGDGTVRMATDEPLAGSQDVIIEANGDAPSGIAQAALGVVEGKKYVGYAWLAAPEGSQAVELRLVWGDGNASDVHQSQVTGDDWSKHSFSFTAGATTDQARLEILTRGGGALRIGTASLMPADNIHGMRADTMKLLRELDAPVYRWPGGNFVSGYDWRDGIGPRDRRPPRKNPAWRGVESNDFGLDEFMVFCRQLDTEPYIAVNSGLGGVYNALAELEYANGSTETPMGKRRADNGHPEPYDVKFWGIGNEMYGSWQLGYMDLAHYVQKHNIFAEKMRAQDPDIVLVGVGNVGPWTEGMLRASAEHMDLISEHFYSQEKENLIEHVRQIPDQVRRIAEAHRRYRQTIPEVEDDPIPVTLDEWNYWYGPHVFGELGTRYFLKDALGIAAGLHEFARCTDVYYMANYAQTVNVIGAIKTSKTRAAFATTGLVLKLYREHFLGVPLEVESPFPLDVAAVVSEDGNRLTVAVVNPTSEGYRLPLSLDGGAVRPLARSFEIAGDDPQLYNEPGRAPRVRIVEEGRDFEGSIDVKPYSATLYVFELK